MVSTVLRVNGLLVDFFSPLQIAESIEEVINNRTLARELGEAARNTVLKQFKLESCVQRQLGLMNLVASGALGQ